MGNNFKIGDKVKSDTNLMLCDSNIPIKEIDGNFIVLDGIPNIRFHYSLLRKAPKFKVGDVVTYYQGRYLILISKWSDSHGTYLYDIVDMRDGKRTLEQNIDCFQLDETHTIRIGDIVCYDGLPYIAGNNSYYAWNGVTIQEFVTIQLRDEKTIYKTINVRVNEVKLIKECE